MLEIYAVNAFLLLVFTIVEIMECAINPCLNGGVCVDRIGSFECQCSDGWEGPRCEQSNYQHMSWSCNEWTFTSMSFCMKLGFCDNLCFGRVHQVQWLIKLQSEIGNNNVENIQICMHYHILLFFMYICAYYLFVLLVWKWV